MRAKIAPSVMCADLANLGRDLDQLSSGGADYLHFDIMDGRFVPNFTLGPGLIRAVRSHSGIPFDIHLMIEEPERYIPVFAKEPGNIVTVHAEATKHLQRVLGQIREAGCLPGVALNPATPLSMLDYVWDDAAVILIMTVNPGFAGQKLVPATLAKIAALHEMLAAAGRDIEVEVDGNVSFEHAPRMRAAGADIFVGGSSSVFSAGAGIVENMRRLNGVLSDASLHAG